MKRKAYCLGVCSSCAVLTAVALAVLAIALGTGYSAINDQVKKQIDKVQNTQIIIL